MELIRDGDAVEIIKREVSNVFNIAPEWLATGTRKRPIVDARHLAIWYCKQYTSFTLKQLAPAFGLADHSGVVHAVQTAESLRATDRAIQLKAQFLDWIIPLKLNPARADVPVVQLTLF